MGFTFWDRLSVSRAMQLFQVMRVGSVIVTSILLAKSGLSTAMIGTYEMLLYMGTTLTFFWVNGLLQGMPSVYTRLSPDDRKAFIFNNFLVFCLLAAGLFLLLFWGEKWLTPVLTGQPEVPYYRLFCLYLLLNLPTFPVEYYYLLHEKPRHIAGWGGVVFGLHVAALYLPVWLGFGLRGGFLALIVLSALKLIWAASLIARTGKMEWRSGLIRDYLRFSTPLTLNVLVGNFIVVFDSWLVGWYYRDEAVFAVFRYGSREFPLATALATALGMAMIPRLAEDLPAGLAEMKARVRRLMHVLFPLTALLFFFIGTAFSPRVQSGFCGQRAAIQYLFAGYGQQDIAAQRHRAGHRGAPRDFWSRSDRTGRKRRARLSVYSLVGPDGRGLVGSRGVCL